MALLPIGNEDLTVDLANLTGPPDIVYVGPVGITDPAVTAVVSPTCKAAGKGMCTTSLVSVWIVAGNDCPHTSILYDFVAGGGTILATAAKVLADGLPVMRETDAGACVGTWKLKVSPFTVVPCTCDSSVLSAGQIKVLAQ